MRVCRSVFPCILFIIIPRIVCAMILMDINHQTFLALQLVFGMQVRHFERFVVFELIFVKILTLLFQTCLVHLVGLALDSDISNIFHYILFFRLFNAITRRCEALSMV